MLIGVNRLFIGVNGLITCKDPHVRAKGRVAACARLASPRRRLIVTLVAFTTSIPPVWRRSGVNRLFKVVIGVYSLLICVNSFDRCEWVVYRC